MNINTITQILNKNGFKNIKQISSKRIFVFVPLRERPQTLKQVLKIFKKYGSKHNPKLYHVSSLGAIEIHDIIIGIKPNEKQGNNNAGIQNELFLFKEIKSFIKKNKKISIKFKNKNKQIIYKNIVGIKHTGRVIQARQKADIILTDYTGKIIPLSLKKDNAQMWESADTYYKHIAKKYLIKLLQKNKIIIKKNKIIPKVAIEATTKESNDVIFGSDIKNNGLVIQKSFSKNDFKPNKKTLTINCTHIFQSLKHIPKTHKPWFTIGPSKARNVPEFFPGLRIVARYYSDVSHTHLKIKTS